MNLEENRPTSPREASFIDAGLEIAAKWGENIGADKLELALKALEPQLGREHEVRMRKMDLQQEAAVREAEEAERVRRYRYRMSGLIAGVCLSIALLTAGVLVARDQPWLATLLCGPSLLALVRIFVIQRSENGDTEAVFRSAREAANASSQSPPVV